MLKYILRFFILITILILIGIYYLAQFGIETNKFDNLIKKETNKINENAKLDFKGTKINLSLKERKLFIKLQKPRILVEKKQINLLRLDLFLPIESFYSSNFILEKAHLDFEKINIKNLIEVTDAFIPKIINDKLNTIFTKGILEGKFIIPFNSDGKISDNYEFYGKVFKADININKDFEIKNLSSDLFYEGDSLEKNLKIIVKDGSLLNLQLLESTIGVSFKKSQKLFKSSIRTEGVLNSSETEKFSSLFGIENINLDDFLLNSNLTTKINFTLNNKYKLEKLDYAITGDITNLQFKIDEKKNIKKYLPNFNPNIVLKNSKIDFNNQRLKLEGDVKFSNRFEKIKIIQPYKKNNKMFSAEVSSTLNNSLVNVSNLNYKKNKNTNADINFKTNFILNKYFLINSFSYTENNSKIYLENVKFDKNFKLIDLEKIEIKTYSNKVKNNDFLVRKSDKIVISGKVFDAQPLLKSLYRENNEKNFSKKFKSQIKVNFDRAIASEEDEVYDFSMIAYIKNGEYNKLSLKANFSDNEIFEMSIYQIDKNNKSVQIISDRAKPFMKNFNFIKGFNGGKLEYESLVSNKSSKSSLKITNFKVSKVPALAQLLTLASLQGIADTLTGEGIRFEVFEMESISKDNILNINEGLAIGPAVSILLDGYIDKGKIVSLRGTLVPATKLNSIIASIPIVGNILVGKKAGEGVVGVSFKMKGPLNDIKTTVNPVKTLTPRFIVRAVEKMKKIKTKNIK